MAIPYINKQVKTIDYRDRGTLKITKLGQNRVGVATRCPYVTTPCPKLEVRENHLDVTTQHLCVATQRTIYSGFQNFMVCHDIKPRCHENGNLLKMSRLGTPASRHRCNFLQG
ncbi:hypothetical protein J1N35_005523 [Gossypium stocksii]|uniref:Uncharacterized protein n=1 Tax=Gossypium stocksii TaxID=47602 RepID=A0A9D3WFE8_9ROSI|nr:hypothetical protein J1N35_005523 [Gossypium stocksii]